LVKLIVKLTVLAVLILGSAACAKSDNNGISSSGDIIVNGLGATGSVQGGLKRFYTLKNIISGQNYTIRTEIPLLSDETTPDGTLTVDIYTSESAFKNGEPAELAVPALSDHKNIYESNFTAASSGDYVIVLSGASLTTVDNQFFYELRLMSAAAAVLRSFATPTVPASKTLTISSGYLHIYSGGAITPSGTYSIRLASTITSTIGHPQMFVYADDTLTINKLLYSSISTSEGFNISSFSGGAPVTLLQETDLISSVTFSGTGPFIVLKGISTGAYTLTVEP